MMLPLTKTLDPADYDRLAQELREVDKLELGEQHPQRRWEYAMALRALRVWSVGNDGPPEVFDVGGGGSPFLNLAFNLCSGHHAVVDPEPPHPSLERWAEFRYFGSPIEEYTGLPVDAITCISVLEHVKNYRPFLRAIAKNLHPGGLAFFTVDYWNCEGEDTAHFHWQRERIYNRHTIKKLLTDASELGLKPYGTVDWAYNGDHVYNYTFLSFALVKERRKDERSSTPQD